ncbi:hypothetical protein EVG20_g9072 [Dentipellis fragilis]|uniref:Uncharacterized protein n=1 Tax=Dentipellis fragilis TaxID=205917 RepID=A0A4Y9Y2T2_9AGAM|nr:hypothetical protein EVG20_g9072 [Dentipellis fragilis]
MSEDDDTAQTLGATEARAVVERIAAVSDTPGPCHDTETDASESGSRRDVARSSSAQRSQLEENRHASPMNSQGREEADVGTGSKVDTRSVEEGIPTAWFLPSSAMEITIYSMIVLWEL